MEHAKQAQENAFVDAQMTIGEIVAKYPDATEPLSMAGIPCGGCGARFDITLSAALVEKGVAQTEIADFVSTLNASIAKIQKDFGLTEGEPKTVALSTRAAEKIRELQAKQSKVGGLRLAAMPGGCSGYSYGLAFEEKPTQNDEVVTEKGVNVYIDKYMLAMLKGVRVDYIDTLQGAGFKIHNPNAKSTCGCGQSFS
ncbi:MAG: iron-sulfur cluster assembly accessory protein [Candidatus Diapherotrites archaeon]|nr:iron-sulfur cluster assembly accessory protein [Candidatus Diapherotrites archaeon]